MRSLIHLIAIALCVQILQVQWSVGQECEFVLEDGTQVEDTGFGYTLPLIQDSEVPGKELLVAKVINVMSITETTWPQERHYIEPALNATHLVLKLTDEFAQYEEYQTSSATGITLRFPCTEQSKQKIEFIVNINDTNNHAPEFVSDPYVYKLPMPLPKNLALTNFAPISARDIDLKNTNISFRLDGNPSGLSVSWLSSSQTDRKLHYAKLVTTATISLVEDVTFNLIATDTGEPPLSTTTTVTIQVDQENSILRFARPLYTANLTELTPEAANGMVIPFAEGEISLGSGADKTVEYVVQDEFGDYGKNFKLIIADDHASVTLQLVDPPTTFFQESSILLKLTASKSGVTETTILHITLPGVDQENSTLRFARPLYTANLTELTPEAANGMVISFAEGEISLGSGADKNVEYVVQDEFGDYGKNFKLIIADDHASVTLQLVDLPTTFFQESSILLKLTASKSGVTETTILHITLPGSGKTIPESGGSENSGESEESEDTPVATIILGILLAIVGISLVASVIVNCMQWRNKKIRS